MRRALFHLKSRQFKLSESVVGSQLHRHEYLAIDILPGFPQMYFTCGSEDDTTLALWKGAESVLKIDTKKWRNHEFARSHDRFALATWTSEVVVYSFSKHNISLDKQAVLAGHVGAVHSVAFSSDSLFLATSGVDSTLKVWSATQGSLLQTLKLPSLPDRVAVEHLRDSRSAALEKHHDLRLLVALASGERVRVLVLTPHGGAETKQVAEIEDAVHETRVHFLRFVVDWDSRTTVLLASGYDGRVNAFELDILACLSLINKASDGAS